MTEEEKDKQRLAQLEELNEKRLKAQQQIELYQARMARAYNKGIRLRTFEKGELVLVIRRPIEIAHKSRGKISGQMGRAVRSRDSLLEWGLQIDNNGRRCAYDACKWEVFEEVLCMIVFTLFYKK